MQQGLYLGGNQLAVLLVFQKGSEKYIKFTVSSNPAQPTYIDSCRGQVKRFSK